MYRFDLIKIGVKYSTKFLFWIGCVYRSTSESDAGLKRRRPLAQPRHVTI